MLFANPLTRLIRVHLFCKGLVLALGKLRTTLYYSSDNVAEILVILSQRSLRVLPLVLDVSLTHESSVLSKESIHMEHVPKKAS